MSDKIQKLAQSFTQKYLNPAKTRFVAASINKKLRPWLGNSLFGAHVTPDGIKAVYYPLKPETLKYTIKNLVRKLSGGTYGTRVILNYQGRNSTVVGRQGKVFSVQENNQLATKLSGALGSEFGRGVKVEVSEPASPDRFIVVSYSAPTMQNIVTNIYGSYEGNPGVPIYLYYGEKAKLIDGPQFHKPKQQKPIQMAREVPVTKQPSKWQQLWTQDEDIPTVRMEDIPVRK